MSALPGHLTPANPQPPPELRRLPWPTGARHAPSRASPRRRRPACPKQALGAHPPPPALRAPRRRAPSAPPPRPALASRRRPAAPPPPASSRAAAPRPLASRASPERRSPPPVADHRRLTFPSPTPCRPAAGPRPRRRPPSGARLRRGVPRRPAAPSSGQICSPPALRPSSPKLRPLLWRRSGEIRRRLGIRAAVKPQI
nr:serine/arginine repetitive matrix protein 1-like [Aegilops tauschii subsp. strangulata]